MPGWQKAVGSGIFGYELAAIWHPALPTISELSKAHPVLAGALVGYIVVHFMED